MPDTADAASLPPCLARLGVSAQAGPREIRRAYAQALKKIDQAGDIAGFQLLREAYEQALELRHDMDPETSGEPAQARRLFERLCAAMRALPAPVRHDDLVAELDSARADPALDSTDARSQFEACLVDLLGGGWQPGHEALLTAAAAVFGWTGAHCVPVRCGARAQLVEQSLEQLRAMDREDAASAAQLRAVLLRARSGAHIAAGQLVDDIHAIERLCTRYQALVAVAAPAAVIARWRTACAALPHCRQRDLDLALVVRALILLLTIVGLVHASGLFGRIPAGPRATATPAGSSGAPAAPPYFQSPRRANTCARR